MNVGVITYKKYDENVLLDAHFNILNLFNIILYDKDFSKFEIFDNNKNLLASTYFSDVENGKGMHILLFKIVREEEIIGTDYNAYRTPSTKHKTKVKWNVSGAHFRTKKEAFEFVEISNGRVAERLEKLIDRKIH